MFRLLFEHLWSGDKWFCPVAEEPDGAADEDEDEEVEEVEVDEDEEAEVGAAPKKVSIVIIVAPGRVALADAQALPLGPFKLEKFVSSMRRKAQLPQLLPHSYETGQISLQDVIVFIVVMVTAAQRKRSAPFRKQQPWPRSHRGSGGSLLPAFQSVGGTGLDAS